MASRLGCDRGELRMALNQLAQAELVLQMKNELKTREGMRLRKFPRKTWKYPSPSPIWALITVIWLPLIYELSKFISNWIRCEKGLVIDSWEHYSSSPGWEFDGSDQIPFNILTAFAIISVPCPITQRKNQCHMQHFPPEWLFKSNTHLTSFAPHFSLDGTSLEKCHMQDAVSWTKLWL
jgi:hypothetical protein